MEKPESIAALQELANPLVKYLKENCDPHCTVIITDSFVRLVRDEIGIPIKDEANL